MSLPIDIRVDVSGSVPLAGRLETAASVYLPPASALTTTPPVVFAFPGATYSRAYYDLTIPATGARYSLAQHLADAGFLVVACDHIGIGDSSPYEPFEDITRDMVIEADQATTEAVVDRLTGGALVDGLPALSRPFIVGLGHSMGARLVLEQQARYSSFHALALLGLTHLQPSPQKVQERQGFLAELAQLADATRPPRRLFHPWFHSEDVPAEVIAADDAAAVRLYQWMVDIILGSGRPIPQESRRAAQTVRVPIFLGFGEQDNSDHPLKEVQEYSQSSDITTFILPGSAHCFNFAETRALFYSRLAAWISGVPSCYHTVSA